MSERREAYEFGEAVSNGIMIQSAVLVDSVVKVASGAIILEGVQTGNKMRKDEAYHENVEVIRIIKTTLNSNGPLATRQCLANPLLLKHRGEEREVHALLLDDLEREVLVGDLVEDEEDESEATSSEELDRLKVRNLQGARGSRNGSCKVLEGCAGV